MVKTGESVPFPMGTININIQEIPSKTLLSNIHGLAFPAFVCVLSIICPATKFPTTIRIAERSGNNVKKVVIAEGSTPFVL